MGHVGSTANTFREGSKAESNRLMPSKLKIEWVVKTSLNNHVNFNVNTSNHMLPCSLVRYRQATSRVCWKLRKLTQSAKGPVGGMSLWPWPLTPKIYWRAKEMHIHFGCYLYQRCIFFSMKLGLNCKIFTKLTSAHIVIDFIVNRSCVFHMLILKVIMETQLRSNLGIQQ